MRAVRLHSAPGCIDVGHDHDEPDELVEFLNAALRGWTMADNGEILHVPTESELAHVCRHDRT